MTGFNIRIEAVITNSFFLMQRLVFDLPVFHPLVDPVSGELDVKRAFAKWRLVYVKYVY